MEMIDNKELKMWIEDGIIFVYFLSETITYNIVDFGIKKRLEMAKGKSYPFFANMLNVKHFPREARERMAQKDAASGTTCVAIVFKSKIQVVLLNFFNRIYKAPAPTKLFTNEEDALAWLKQQIININNKKTVNVSEDEWSKWLK